MEEMTSLWTSKALVLQASSRSVRNLEEEAQEKCLKQLLTCDHGSPQTLWVSQIGTELDFLLK